MFRKLGSITVGLVIILASSFQPANASSSISVSSKAPTGGALGLSLVPVSTTYSLAVWAEAKSPSSYKLMAAKVSAAGKFSPATKVADITSAFQTLPHFEIAVNPKKSTQIAWVNSSKTVEYGTTYYHSDLMFTSSADGAKWSKPAKAATSGKTSKDFCSQAVCGYVVTALSYDKSNRLNLIYAMSASMTKISIIATSTLDLKTWTKPTLVIGSRLSWLAPTTRIAPTATGLIAAGLDISSQRDGIWASVKAKSSATTWSTATLIASACAVTCHMSLIHLIPSSNGDVTVAWLETTAARSTLQLNSVAWSHVTKTWGAKTTLYTGQSIVSYPYDQYANHAQNGNRYVFTWAENQLDTNAANFNALDYKAAVFTNGVFSNILDVHHQDAQGTPGSYWRSGLAISSTGVVDEILADLADSTAFVSEVSATSPAVETTLLVDLPTLSGSTLAYNANGKLLVMQISGNQITTAMSRMISILNR
jgi:hypothetical protein